MDSGGFILRIPVTGLDFPGNTSVSTVRFRFANPQSNGLPIFGPSGAGVTYIWKAYPRSGQTGYWTSFFWGNDQGNGNFDDFLWVPGGSADTYYGPHPYPPGGASGTTHEWEISVEQQDFTNGSVTYDRWHDQAFIAWGAAGVAKQHEYYWDLPNTDASHRVTRTTASTTWGDTNPPAPYLTIGDAPWNPGEEVYKGILRGFQFHAAKLTLTQANLLKTCQTNAQVLALCAAQSLSAPWYLNMNPTPTDISDYSGNGHHPSWVGATRPALWVG